MRIVALLAVRDEEPYMERCLDYLFQQGIETCVIDNGSTDGTREIAERFIGRGVIRIDDLPYPGFFDLVGQLRLKERLSAEIEADWFIHQDADEIREAPVGFMTLRHGIEAIDGAGYSAIDFDEFVFVPTSPEEQFEERNYVKDMRYYYFFRPQPLHRVNAWKKVCTEINLVDSGGHRVEFNGIRVYPEKFVLRHYIALSAAHAKRKYGQRIYSEKEIEQFGWHRARTEFSPDRFCLPSKHDLKYLPVGSNLFDRSQPEVRHPFFGGTDTIEPEQSP